MSWFQVRTMNCTWMIMNCIWMIMTVYEWKKRFGLIEIGLTECSIMKVLYLKVYSTHDSSKEFTFEFEQGQLGTIIWLDIFSHSQSAHLPQNHNVYTIHLIYSWPGQLSGTRIRSYLWAFLHNSEWITKKIEIRNQLVRLARTSGTAYSSIDLFYFIL